MKSSQLISRLVETELSSSFKDDLVNFDAELNDLIGKALEGANSKNPDEQEFREFRQQLILELDKAKRLVTSLDKIRLA